MGRTQSRTRSRSRSRAWAWALLTLWAAAAAAAEEPKPTRWPLFGDGPLLLAWNAPTQECGPRHGVPLALGHFHVVASPNEGFVRQNVTIFYKERLGLYPYYGGDGTAVNGGLPQLASLTRHYGQMPGAVAKYIREPGAKGLAVIDWEEWRPLWARNWDSKDVYRRKSKEMVAGKNPRWSAEQVSRVAEREFELSGRDFLLGTLRYAKSLRPRQLWGFYLFPDCYNHDYKSAAANYTGRCPPLETRRNDRLAWLWAECTALFPSVYLDAALRSSRQGRLFVRHRVGEAVRLAEAAAGPRGPSAPVFVYTRPTYANRIALLTETDLVSTVGESVALGAAGLIFWGDASYANSQENCSLLDGYLRGPLGRYLLNVSTAAQHCSRAACASRGRCLRRRPDQDAYLHLSPLTHSIGAGPGGRLEVSGAPGRAELQLYRAHFRCQCYRGYGGGACAQREAGRNAAAASSVGGTRRLRRLLLLLVLVLVPLGPPPLLR